MLRALVLLGMLFLISCDGNKPSTGVKPTETIDASQVSAHGAASAGKIAWFDGTIEAAFAQAQATDKPIFLYWGAVWCPPCQEIKHTVFKSKAFIELSELFIPVYLDGDTDRAQAWGESFGVKGYPTMIVFNPAGEEMTRIPGGIDIERYNAVLALALNEMRPTSELVAMSLEAPTRLRPEDFQQLAYYSWWQDSAAIPADVDRISLFRQLTSAAPAGALQARFFMNTLAVLAEEKTATLTETDRQMLSDILASEELTLACWDTLAYSAADILPMVAGTEREAIASQWQDQLFRLRHHASLSRSEALAGWFPLLESSSGTIGNAQKKLLEQELVAAEKATQDKYERQSVIYQISEIYRAAGMLIEAKNLLLAELDRSASPYYFMSGLAVLAEEAGQNDEALSWRGSAWETAVGEATRFQWGVSYLLSMIRLAPDRVSEIRSTTDKVMAEVDSSEALFAGRNYRRLKALNESISQWEESQDLTDARFHDSLVALCSEQEDGSLAQQNCLRLTADHVLARNH